MLNISENELYLLMVNTEQREEEVYKNGELEVKEALLEGEKNEKKEREPEESAFQKEMRELEKENKAFAESTKTFGSIWFLARQEKQAAAVKEGEDEEELKAAQVKERMNSALSKAESAFLMAEQLAEGVVATKLDEVKGINLQSAGEDERLAALLKELMQKFDKGEITVMAGDAPLKLDDKIPPHSKIRVVGQEQEEEFLAKAA